MKSIAIINQNQQLNPLLKNIFSLLLGMVRGNFEVAKCFQNDLTDRTFMSCFIRLLTSTSLLH